MKKIFYGLFMICLVSGFCHAEDTLQPPGMDFYQYRKYTEQELAVTSTVEMETEDYTRLCVKYRSESGWVWGTFFMPKRVNKPVPVIVGIHGIWSPNRQQFWSSAVILAQHGFAVFLPSLPYHHQRKKKHYILSGQPFINYNLAQTRRNFYQALADIRRGIDWLCTLPDIDASRIGVVGVSLGGVVTSLLLKVEPRISTGVLLVSGGDIKETILYSRTYVVKFLRLGLTLRLYDVEDMVREWRPMDPSTYPRTKQPILMINGKNDIIFSVHNVKKLYDTWENARIIWTTSGHQIPELFAQYYLLNFLKKRFRYHPEISFGTGLTLINVNIREPGDDEEYFKMDYIYRNEDGVCHNILELPLVNTKIVGNKAPLVFISPDSKEEDVRFFKNGTAALVFLEKGTRREIRSLLEMLHGSPWVEKKQIYYYHNELNCINFPEYTISPGDPSVWLKRKQNRVRIETDPVW